MKCLLILLTLALAASARADTCATMTADPASYSAPAGGSWTVYVTIADCGTDYIHIGGGFGTDESPFVSDHLLDPFLVLAPGESKSVAFDDYTWHEDAPAGFSWTAFINADYGVSLTADGFPNEGGKLWSSFTATVTPVPEPGTLALLVTGLAGLWARRRHA